MLLFTFTKLLINVRSKLVLSLMFSIAAAVLSAFLDALTVTAVIIAVAAGFYGVYHKVASGKHFHHSEHDSSQDHEVQELHREDLDRFRAFLRSLVMHGAVGTALGGVMTLVGEPQNLLIANVAGWDFIEFFTHGAGHHSNFLRWPCDADCCRVCRLVRIWGKAAGQRPRCAHRFRQGRNRIAVGA